MEPFANTSAGQKQWRSVLHAIEARVVLVRHREGTLTDQLADYLYARAARHGANAIHRDRLHFHPSAGWGVRVEAGAATAT